jgi:hypothetical protein
MLFTKPIVEKQLKEEKGKKIDAVIIHVST